MKEKGEYQEEVDPPRYLPKDGYFTVQFIPRQIKRVKNQLRLSLGKRGKESMGVRFIWITIPNNIRKYLIKMVRVVPKYNGEYFEI